MKIGDRVRDVSQLMDRDEGVVTDINDTEVLVKYDKYGEDGWWPISDYEVIEVPEIISENSTAEPRREWSSGAVRDANTGKPRPDLISVRGRLRLAEVMATGAEHYGERNWEKGIPSSAFWESLNRHLLDYEAGLLPLEDHLAQAAFNLFALMHNEGTEWDDLGWGGGK